jgi:hypothetical protein
LQGPSKRLFGSNHIVDQRVARQPEGSADMGPWRNASIEEILTGDRQLYSSSGDCRSCQAAS